MSAEKQTKQNMLRLSAAQKRELTERQAELQRMLLPDAPPRKRRTTKPSPEREPCELVPQPSTSRAPVPQPLAVEEYVVVPVSPPSQPVPSTSRAPEPMGVEEYGVNDSNFADVVDDWLLDSDSDIDCNEIDDIRPIPTTVQTVDETDLRPDQLEVLQTEDTDNDNALQRLFPEDDFHFLWSKEKTAFTSERETFTGTPGPTFDFDTPTDVFEQMFETDFIDRLCDETNRYARQKIAALKDANKLTPCSRLHQWTPTDRQEMIAYLTLTILQGLYPQPTEESYFKFNGFGTMPYFTRIMTYNRYLLLKRFLHFVDNDTLTDLPNKTKLCKIKPVLDYLNDKFTGLYRPGQEIAIDESLLKWHGRLSFAQKISSKAARVGVKTYELCESSSGYLWRFSVYTGKDKTDNADTTDKTNDDNNEDDQNRQDRTEPTTDFRPTNATAKIVFDLVEPLLYLGHTIIMDNFYNCPLLARCLKRRMTDCYGTQRLNRAFIPNSLRTMTKTDLRQGEVVATYCSDLSLMVWRDANLVSMISTYHRLQIGEHEKYNRTSYKPGIVLDYNKHMGGVDRKDQFLSAHPVERVRNRVWYKKLFRRLFSAAIFNCFVIFHTKHGNVTHRQFRTTLAETLLKTYRQIDLKTETRLITRTCGQKTGTVTQRNSRLTNADRPVVESDHFPVHAETKRGRCWMCSQKNVVSRTIWKCLECNVKLCIVGCFREYHKP